MADRESNTANAFETTLTSDMGDTDLTANVETTSGGPASPAYLVIDPDEDSKREIIYFDGSFTSTSFSTTSLSNRYLDGSAAGSGIVHNTGAKVVSVPVSQLWVDVNDRVEGHDHDGVGDTQVDHGALLGLTDDDHTQYAKLIGDTFTGAVTMNDVLTVLGAITGDSIRPEMSTDEVTETAAPTSYPNGITIMQVTGWSVDTVATINWGDSGRTWQLGIAFSNVVYTRRWVSGSAAWSDWREVASPADVGRFEVDNSTEVSSFGSLTTSYQPVASVDLAIPSSWGSWRCEAYATFVTGSDTTSSNAAFDAVINIDGANQQAIVNVGSGQADFLRNHSVGGRRTGITTTGTRSANLSMRRNTSDPDIPTVQDIYLYARAVRTS